MRRAIETADAFASALNVEVESCEHFDEMRLGDADEMTWDEMASEFGSDWKSDRSQPIAPGGESVDSFVRRCRQDVDWLVMHVMATPAPAEVGAPVRSCVVFTHGSFVLALEDALRDPCVATRVPWGRSVPHLAVMTWRATVTDGQVTYQPFRAAVPGLDPCVAVDTPVLVDLFDEADTAADSERMGL